MSKIESYIFIIATNFISSCYKRDWTWLELARAPSVYHGNYVSEQLNFDVPLWFPSRDAILFINGSNFQSKIKDLPLEIKEHAVSNKEKRLTINASKGKLPDVNDTRVIYSPLFRYAVEPMNFDIEHKVSKYLVEAVGYKLRSEGYLTKTSTIQNGFAVTGCFDVENNTSTIQVEAIGLLTIDRLLLKFGKKLTFDLDTRVKTLMLESLSFPLLHNAFTKMSASIELKNCMREIDDHRVLLKYVS